MADFSAVYTMGSDAMMGVINFFIYALPFFGVAILLLIGFFIMRKRKVFGLDTIIYTVCDNNLIQGRDKGGIVKNLLGEEEFRFRKRKKGCPTPNRKFWIMQDNGRFCIHFFRHSEDDFEPCEAKPTFMEVPVPNKKAGVMSKVKGLVQGKMGDVPTDNSLKVADIKKDLMGIKFTPIKSDSKQYLNMKAKEIVYKNKIKKSTAEQWKPVIFWGALCITFIILVIWYFKYAGILVDKQIMCTTAEEVKAVVQAMKDGGAAETVKEGFRNPFG